MYLSINFIGLPINEVNQWKWMDNVKYTLDKKEI